MVQLLSSVVSFIQDRQQHVPLTSCVAGGSLPHGLHGCRGRCLHGTALHGCLLPHDLHGRCRGRCLHGTALHCCLLPHDLHGWCCGRLHGTALHRCLLLHDLHGLHCLHGLRHCWKRKRFWIMKEQTLQMPHLSQ